MLGDPAVLDAEDSENSAGSDVAAIKTTAVRDGEDYVINGTKMWITNGAQADWMCMLANNSDASAHRNKSLICVPLKENGKYVRGVTVSRELKKRVAYSSIRRKSISMMCVFRCVIALGKKDMVSVIR